MLPLLLALLRLRLNLSCRGGLLFATQNQKTYTNLTCWNLYIDTQFSARQRISMFKAFHRVYADLPSTRYVGGRARSGAVNTYLNNVMTSVYNVGTLTADQSVECRATVSGVTIDTSGTIGVLSKSTKCYDKTLWHPKIYRYFTITCHLPIVQRSCFGYQSLC